MTVRASVLQKLTLIIPVSVCDWHDEHSEQGMTHTNSFTVRRNVTFIGRSHLKQAGWWYAWHMTFPGIWHCQALVSISLQLLCFFVSMQIYICMTDWWLTNWLIAWLKCDFFNDCPVDVMEAGTCQAVQWLAGVVYGWKTSPGRGRNFTAGRR